MQSTGAEQFVLVVSVVEIYVALVEAVMERPHRGLNDERFRYDTWIALLADGCCVLARALAR